MKQFKLMIMTLVVISSAGLAFTTRPATLQTGLYYWNGSAYLPAGVNGRDYFCESNASTNCTYTKSGNTYTPYTLNAMYVPLDLTDKTKPAVKKDK